MTQLEDSRAGTDFDRTTALIPVAARPGEFLVDLDGGWSSLVGVHGGYMCDLTIHIHRSGFALRDDAWLAGCFESHDSTGGLAVEHGRIIQKDGTVVAESFQTRLTAQN
jgi:hypothetical protein